MRAITVALIIISLPFFSQAQNRHSRSSHAIPSIITSYKVVDVMPPFWQFWERAQTLDEPAKVSLFRELVLQPNKDVFEGFTGPASDERLTQYFVKVQQYIPAMRRFYERLQSGMPHYGQTFKKHFPDAGGDATIYFMPNLLGGWDAGSGDLDGHTALILGVDSIVQLHKEGFDIAPLFHHELFHIYHAQFHPEWNGKSRMKGEIPLYWLMWTEGLATYVSKVLNPKADMEGILLSDELVRDTNRRMPELAKEVRENLDSTSTDAFMNFLSGRPKQKDIPVRSGYYIGMLIARELRKKHSLRELAKLGGPQLRKEMEAALIKFESPVKPGQKI